MKKKSINMSNEAFLEAMISILTTDYEAEKKEILRFLNEELSKPDTERDYITIHECYLALSECCGYKYENEYKKLAEKQERKIRIMRTVKNIFIGKAAIF